MTQILSVMHYLSNKGIVVRHLPLESIYFTTQHSIHGTLRVIDLLFAASLDEIPDEPEFLLEYAYQTPSNLYVKNKGAGKLSRVSQFAKFNHSFSAPEMLPERFSYENGEEREENLPSEE